MTKTTKLTLALIFLLQLLMLPSFELAHDEAYYWLYSRHLDWGFFDHPPMVGLVIRLFSFLPFKELSVRLGFLLMQFATLWILLRMLPTGARQTGWMLFFCFPLASFAGILALPDMPLLFFTACYCYGLQLYLEKDDLRSALLLGLVIPLLLYSKYHGILLIFFTLLALPQLLRRRSFYLIAAVAMVLFAPHLWWQHQHDYVTLRYHFLERPGAGLSLGRILEYFAIQLLLPGLWMGPLVWWVMAKKASGTPFERAMKFIAWGTLLFFFISSLNKRIEANWTIFLTIPLILLVSDSLLWVRPRVRSLLFMALVLVIASRLLLLFPPEVAKVRRLQEFHYWEAWAREVAQECGDRRLVANTYQIASKLSFYLQRPVPALNLRSRRNQFDLWQFQQDYPSEKVCYVTPDPRWEGQPAMLSPDGKKRWLVTNYSPSELIELE
jgi:4-amino-4-deoxy-L-arabinose transferase-like glycosyltransferase